MGSTACYEYSTVTGSYADAQALSSALPNVRVSEGCTGFGTTFWSSHDAHLNLLTGTAWNLIKSCMCAASATTLPPLVLERDHSTSLLLQFVHLLLAVRLRDRALCLHT